MREIVVSLRVTRGRQRTYHPATYQHFETLDEALAALGADEALVRINRATRHEDLRVARLHIQEARSC